MTEMLKVVDLHACAGEREILKGVNLTVNEGETCVLFGPNGSGRIRRRFSANLTCRKLFACGGN